MDRRRSQHLGPSSTLGSLGPSHQRASHVPGVTPGSPLCPWCFGHSSWRGAQHYRTLLPSLHLLPYYTTGFGIVSRTLSLLRHSYYVDPTFLPYYVIGSSVLTTNATNTSSTSSLPLVIIKYYFHYHIGPPLRLYWDPFITGIIEFFFFFLEWLCSVHVTLL